ncbi:MULTISPECIES: GTP-binding protein [Streptomyces]|uniref:GTP-binding protein n=1 Tax=Streptomyces lycii TaxID=2654337 RepID=A0ABQ7FQE4_9ACTN|nr:MULTISPECIES: GTP-binding protein [Streptomyces]KAF4409448.1 GTP-binding protein [Streptomyces lycii]PGH48213.1 cobalamin biosynthesis protein [Streptomyces sp. Ru87]
MPRKQIPVVVLAGFLGSGKTTLLNHLLTGSRGTRIGAVVNDFGSIEIDAMAVAGQVDSMISLGNGCLCCAVDTSELDGLLERLARPEAGIDVIVIEASGLAEPQELIRMILAADSEHIVYGGLVEVVDAAEFARTRAAHPELDRHIGIADLVVLNKADRVTGPGREELLRTLTGLAGGVPVLPVSYGRIDPDLLFDRSSREDDHRLPRQLSFEDLRGDDDCAAHPHAAYDTVAFTSEEPMDPRRLMEFLDSRPAGLYRIKGFVHFGVHGYREKYTLHAVGSFLRFQPAPWGRDEPRTTQLVLIGTGTDPGALRKELDACRAGGTQDPADDRSMWGILRYVREPERTADQRDPDEQEPDRWDLGRWDPDQQDPVE